MSTNDRDAVDKGSETYDGLTVDHSTPVEAPQFPAVRPLRDILSADSFRWLIEHDRQVLASRPDAPAEVENGLTDVGKMREALGPLLNFSPVDSEGNYPGTPSYRALVAESEVKRLLAGIAQISKAVRANYSNNLYPATLRPLVRETADALDALVTTVTDTPTEDDTVSKGIGQDCCATCGHIEDMHVCTFTSIRCLLCVCRCFQPDEKRMLREYEMMLDRQKEQS